LVLLFFIPLPVELSEPVQNLGARRLAYRKANVIVAGQKLDYVEIMTEIDVGPFIAARNRKIDLNLSITEPLHLTPALTRIMKVVVQLR
jgi:hypothetical protein